MKNYFSRECVCVCVFVLSIILHKAPELYAFGHTIIVTIIFFSTAHDQSRKYETQNRTKQKEKKKLLRTDSLEIGCPVQSTHIKYTPYSVLRTVWSDQT